MINDISFQTFRSVARPCQTNVLQLSSSELTAYRICSWDATMLFLLVWINE